MKLLRFLLMPLLLATVIRAEPPLSVAIQPLGPVKQPELERVKAGIVALYGVTVEILPTKAMPASAYYPPRKRYKADKLLDVLENQTPANFTKVIGFTTRDISTDKDDVVDWGIFGLGQISGRPCVVSTFRLSRGVPRAKMLLRTGDVVGHEAGHTFGLQHCASPHCMMNDAEGKIQSVDESTRRPCESCRRLLGDLVRD